MLAQANVIKWAVVALLLLSVVAYVAVLRQQNSSLTTERDALTTQLKLQNEQIQQVADDAARVVEEGKKKLLVAEKRAAAAEKKAGSIYARPPSTPGDDCGSALSLINNHD